MKKVVKIALGITGSVMIAGAGFTLGRELGKNEKNIAVQNAENVAKAADTIAVVNMDDGTTLSGEQVNYASHLMEFPDDNFVQTGLDDAKLGVKSGNYAAYVVIPADFTQSVESIESNPSKAVLEYDINSDLDSDDKEEVIYDVLDFQKSLNSNVAYTYVNSILSEFHNVQDNSSKVLSNNENQLSSIKSINADELVTAVEFSELKQVENTVTPVDLQEYYNKNESVINDMTTSFDSSIQKGVSDFEQVKTGQQSVGMSADTFFQKLGTMDLLRDADGNSVIATGDENIRDNLFDMLKQQTETQQSNVNNNLILLQTNINSNLNTIQEKNQASVNAQLKSDDPDGLKQTLQAQIDKQALDYKTQIISDIKKEYKEKLGSGNICIKSDGLQSYGNQVKDQCQTVANDQFNEALKNAVDEKLPGEVKAEVNKELAEKVAANTTAVLDSVDQKIDTMSEDGFTPDQIALIKNKVAALRGETPGATPADEGVAPVVDPAESNIDLSSVDLSKITIEQKNIDDEIENTDLTKAGESFSIVLDTSALDNKIKMPAVEKGEVDVKDANKVHIDVANDVAKDLFVLTQPKEEDTKAKVGDYIKENLTDKLEKNVSTKTTSMKEEADTLQNSMEDYQKTLTDFDPYKYYTDADMTSYLDSVKTNMQTIQKNIDDNQKQYKDFSDLVYQTADENVLTLQQDMQKASESTAQSINSTIGSLQSTSETATGQNVEILGSFTDKLPYTRVGSVDNTQVYDFMVDPVEMKSTTQARQITQATITEQEKKEQIPWQQIVIIGAAVVVCILMLLNIIRSKKQMDDTTDDMIH